MDPELDTPGWEAVAEDGVPLDGDLLDEEGGAVDPPGMDLADDEPVEDADEGEVLEGPLPDEGEPSAVSPSSSSGSSGSSESSSVESSSAEEPDDGVPEALGEVEVGETLPPVAGPGDPDDEVPEVVLEGELPPGEPAAVVGVLEPEL